MRYSLFVESDMNSTAARQQASAVRWGIISSIIFGSVGWIIGTTIPGNLHGTNPIAPVLWSIVMGALGYIPGDVVGRTSAEIQTRAAR